MADQEKFCGGALRLPAVQLSRQGSLGTAVPPGSVKGQAQGRPTCACPRISTESAEGHTSMQHFLPKRRLRSAAPMHLPMGSVHGHLQQHYYYSLCCTQAHRQLAKGEADALLMP